jgi:prophage regulatory protein
LTLQATTIKHDRSIFMESFIASSEQDNTVRTLSQTIAEEKSHEVKPRTLNHRDTRSITRPRELPLITGLSKTTCWRLEKSGDFPKRIQLSAGAVGYRTSELLSWLESRQYGRA